MNGFFRTMKEKLRLSAFGNRWSGYMKKPQDLMKTCAMLSVYTMIVFNIPALALVASEVECNWNGVLIFVSVAILMLLLNYMIGYLLLWLGRVVGKVVISLSFVLNAVCLYAIHTFKAYITAPTIANVFNTNTAEASGFFSLSVVIYVLLLAVPACIYLFAKKIDYSKFRNLSLNVLASLLLIVLVVLANIHNVLWIDKNSTLLGGRIMPWSYVVNTVRHFNMKAQENKKEIPLPDAEITTTTKDVCVLIIGESARRENFSLYGYHRDTNPLLSRDSVTAYIADSEDVSTIGGVKAILDHKGTDKLYEILPNYMFRNGVDVVWRTANWGQPPLHIEKYIDHNGLADKYPGADRKYDGVLLAGLADEIRGSDKDKLLVVLHCSTSHGPKYFDKYPAEFNRFTPVCTNVEISSADKEGLVNAYDNTILYTDYLVHSVIETLRQLPDRRCCMIYVSDHGESLGENNLFMHGTMPRSLAPRQQFEIPFIVWENDSATRTKKLESVRQFYVFHTVMNWFGMQGPVYNEEMNLFEPVE